MVKDILNMRLDLYVIAKQQQKKTLNVFNDSIPV